MWGCEEPAQYAVWVDDEENEYFSCPIKLIPDNIFEWFEEYNYYQLYPGSMPTYDNIPAKWYQALLTYRNHLSEYSKEKKPEHRSDMSALKQTIMQRKSKGK